MRGASGTGGGMDADGGAKVGRRDDEMKIKRLLELKMPQFISYSTRGRDEIECDNGFMRRNFCFCARSENSHTRELVLQL